MEPTTEIHVEFFPPPEIVLGHWLLIPCVLLALFMFVAGIIKIKRNLSQGNKREAYACLEEYARETAIMMFLISICVLARLSIPWVWSALIAIAVLIVTVTSAQWGSARWIKLHSASERTPT